MDTFIDSLVGSPIVVSSLLGWLVLQPAGVALGWNLHTHKHRATTIKALAVMLGLFVFGLVLLPAFSSSQMFHTLVPMDEALYSAYPFGDAEILTLYDTFLATDPAGVEAGGALAAPTALLGVVGWYAVSISAANDPLALIVILLQTKPNEALAIVSGSIVVGVILGFALPRVKSSMDRLILSASVVTLATILGLAPLTVGIVAGIVDGWRRSNSQAHFYHANRTDKVCMWLAVILTLVVLGWRFDLSNPYTRFGMVYGFWLRLLLVMLPLTVVGIIRWRMTDDRRQFIAWVVLGVMSGPAIGVPSIVVAEQLQHHHLDTAAAIRGAAVFNTLIWTVLTIATSKWFPNLPVYLWAKHPVDESESHMALVD